MLIQGFPHVSHSSHTPYFCTLTHFTIHTIILNRLRSQQTVLVDCLTDCLGYSFGFSSTHFAIRHRATPSLPTSLLSRSFVSVLYTFSLCEHRPSYSSEWRQRFSSSSSNLTPRWPLRQQQAWQSVANAILWEDLEPVANSYSIRFCSCLFSVSFRNWIFIVCFIGHLLKISTRGLCRTFC